MKWISLTTLLIGLAVGAFLSAYLETPESSDRGPVPVSARTLGAGSSPVRSAEEASGQGFVSEQWLDSLKLMTPVEGQLAIGEMVQQLAVEDYAAVLQLVKDTPPPIGPSIRDLVSRQWVQVDPHGMLAYAKSLDTKEQYAVLNLLFSQWAKIDFEEAWADMLHMENDQHHSSFSQIVLHAGIDEQPLHVLERLVAGDIPAPKSPWLYQQVFAAIAKHDPQQARKLAMAMAPSINKQNALRGSIQQLLSDDFEAAITWLDSLPTDSAVLRAREQALYMISHKDFDSLKALIESQVDPAVRREYLDHLNLNNAPRNQSFERAIEIYEWMNAQGSGRLKQNSLGSIVASMVQSDKERAADFVLQLPFGRARMAALNAMANSLAEQDLHSVVAFADTLPNEEERRAVLQNISHRIREQGVESVVAFFSQHPSPILEKELASGLVEEWAKIDREEAIEWMAQLGSQDVFHNAQSGLINVWAQEDPQGAVAYIENEVEPKRRDEAYRRVINQMVYNDPEAAIAWLTHLPEREVTTEKAIYQQIANTYSDVDPLAASEWIAEMEGGELRDVSVESLVRNIMRAEPDSAFIWANSVEDVMMRKNNQQRTIREWAKQDPDAAYRAVREASIDAAEKEPLFEVIESVRDEQSDGQSQDASFSNPVQIHVVR